MGEPGSGNHDSLTTKVVDSEKINTALAVFIEEIVGVKPLDANLTHVDVEKLQDTERLIWDKYKAFFVSFDNFFADFSLDQIESKKKDVQALLVRVEEIGVELINMHNDKDKSDSRALFIQCMRVRMAAIFESIRVLLNPNPVLSTPEEDLDEVRLIIKEERRKMLEVFRVEIKNIVERMKVKDGTVAEVENVGELDESDMDLWRYYQDILVAIENLDVKSGKEKIEESLDSLLDKTMILNNKVSAVIMDKTNKDRNSKKAFAGWLNNRNPANKIINSRRRIEDEGFVRAVKTLKEKLKISIDFYAKDGWKKDEVKTQ
jgi:hypothetical protein